MSAGFHAVFCGIGRHFLSQVRRQVFYEMELAMRQAGKVKAHD